MSTDNVKITAVIPARYNSSRFPGKPLAKIGSRSMIEWTCRSASSSRLLSDVVVATDDARIHDEVLRFGGKCIMTSPEHESGTDRIIEVAGKLESDIIVNIQGDEPGIEAELIDGVIELKLKNRNWEMTTAATLLKENPDDPNRVKVVFDHSGRALYFSRSVIPSNFKNPAEIYRHLGIYCFEKTFLMTYNSLPASSYEKSESLEQLRAIQAGKTIGVFLAKDAAMSVDTPSDLETVIHEFDKKGWI